MRMHLEDARAFAGSLAHRESTEGAASVVTSGNVVELDYRFDLQWPWPRRFQYRLEYVAVAEAEEVIDTVDTDHELVVSLFDPEFEAHEGHLEEAGLTRAWLSPIMGRDLSQAWPRPFPSYVQATKVTSASQRRRFNSVPGISNRSESLDEHIHYFYIEREGEVAAKGQLVYLGGGTAYISDLFTAASHRRQGLCTAMMMMLEAEARRLGAERAVLAPGREQIELELYERYGYATTATRAVLIAAAERE